MTTSASVPATATDCTVESSPQASPARRKETLEALNKLRQIPALHSLAKGFTHTLGRPDVSVTEIVEAIEKDSALCVRVLRMSNSAMVSPEQKIEDLATAVQMLGVKRVRLTAQTLFTLRDTSQSSDGFDWRHLWIHAIATAAIAEEIAGKVFGADCPGLYLAALMHDIGKIVLATVAPELYRQILVQAWNGSCALEELERQRLGIDHREAGLVFARLNGLPDAVAQSIAHHNTPALAEGNQTTVALVCLANQVSKHYGLGFSGSRLDDDAPEFEDLEAWRILETETGRILDRATIRIELEGFVAQFKTELRMMHAAA